MKKVLALVGLSAVLASCGTIGVTPNAFVNITGLRTEYRANTAAGGFVACDNVAGQNVINNTQITQVAAYFTTDGDVQQVRVQLRGDTTTENDDNYRATFTRQQLDAVNSNDGRFKAVFDADSTVGFLPTSVRPQAIVVNPVDRKVKVVQPVGQPAGRFYVTVGITDSEGNQATASSNNVYEVPVYATCNAIATTNEDI